MLEKLLELIFGPMEPEKKEKEGTKPPQPSLTPPKPQPMSPPPPEVETKPEEDDLWIEMKSPYVKTILTEFFIPYQKQFESQQAKEGFLSLVELLDQNGDCPSVTIDDKKMKSFASLLRQIPLKDHSLHVAQKIKELVKMKYEIFYPYHIPEAITAALAHDIGKIPYGFGKDRPRIKADHPILGAETLRAIFLRKKPHWLDNVIEAIKDHHRLTTNPLSKLLKEADRKAREEEVLQFNPYLKIQPREEWIDPNRLLQIIVPDIDKIKEKNKFKAFSWKSIVYVQPDALYEALKQLAKEKQIVDFSLLMDSDQTEVKIEIINALRRANMLALDIQEGYRGRPFEVIGDKFQKTFFLVPIKIEAFGYLPSQFTKRQKPGYLGMIKEVRVPIKEPKPRWGSWPNY
jgi:hypothetical protein